MPFYYLTCARDDNNIVLVGFETLKIQFASDLKLTESNNGDFLLLKCL